MTKKPTEKLKNLCRSSQLPDLLEENSSVEIEDVIMRLEKAKEKGHTYIRLEVNTSEYGYYTSVSFEVWHLSDETDEEFDSRVAIWQEVERKKRETAKERKAKHEAEQRALYEKLKKKFDLANS